MIRLAVFDVDGTLYSHKAHCIPKSAVEAIKELRKQGIQIAIASGRPAFVLQNVIEAGIEFDYVVGCNGHCVYRGTNELLGGFSFTKEMVDDLTTFCVENDYPLNWKFPYANYMYNRAEEFEDINRNLKIQKVYECYQRNHHEIELPFGGVAFMPQDVADAYSEEHPEVSFLAFEPDRYDVSLSNVNKGVGLELLLKEIGLTFDECIAFGDGANDVEMLSKVGISVAMKECHPSLLGVCDYHTDDCLEDGIANALRYYQLIDLGGI